MRSTAYSLGAALRVCQQCAAVSPSREWRLLDRVTESRCQPGQQILVRMDGVPVTDSRGRIAHVRGFYMNAQAVVAVADVTNDVLTAYNARGIFPSIFLRDFTGWTYLDDLDARTILDDQYFRHGGMQQWRPLQSGIQAVSDFQTQANPYHPGSTISADAGIPVDHGTAEDYLVDVSWYFPLTEPGGRHPLRGLIPMAMLQRVSNNALTIRVGTTFPTGPANLSFTNLQVFDPIADVTRNGCDIWVDLVWLDGLVLDAPWQLDEYTLSDLTGTLLNPERISEYAWVRYFPEDDGGTDGQVLAQGLDNLTVTVAGFTIRQGQRIDDAVQQMFLEEMGRCSRGSMNRQNAGQSLPLNNATESPYALDVLPYRQRQGAAAGPVSYSWGTRTGSDFTRYVHRTVTCHSGNRAKQIEQRLKMGPCHLYGSDPVSGNACNGIQPYEPVISVPRKLTHR